MYKDGMLTISEWQKGMGDSSLVGFQSMVNVDIFETPGALSVAPSVGSTLSTLKLPIASIFAKDGNLYMIASTIDTYGSTGTLYKNGASFSSITGAPWDIVQAGDYIFISTNAGTIDRYGPLSTSPAYTSGWLSGFSTKYYLKMIVDENPDASLGSDAIYLCNGNVITKITNYTGAGTATTGLTLPANEYAVTLAPLGGNLMIGTQSGSNWYYRASFPVANIYPWNKVSTDSFRLPVKLQESGVNAMISKNNRLYVQAGDRGNVYVTDSTNYIKIKRIPWSQHKRTSVTMTVYPNAIAFNQNENLLIGTSSSYIAATADDTKHGVYEISLTGGYATTLKRTISTGSVGNTKGLLIGHIFYNYQSLYIGWLDNVTYGLDTVVNYTTGSLTLTSYPSYIESPLVQIGTRLNRKTFQNLEIQLAEPLDSTQAVRVSYRKNLSATYTTIATFDYNTIGSATSHNVKALLDDVENLQIKVELQNGTPYDNVYLMNIRIW